MSPFIVTTKRPPSPPDYSRSGNVVSRLAVATLEEALRKTHDMIFGAEVNAGGGLGKASMDSRFDRAYEQWEALSESGGTVGPLPDGTTIQVELAAVGDLAAAALVANDYHFGELTEAEVIAAFNAEQAS